MISLYKDLSAIATQYSERINKIQQEKARVLDELEKLLREEVETHTWHHEQNWRILSRIDALERVMSGEHAGQASGLTKLTKLV
jgi:hypothetical protein